MVKVITYGTYDCLHYGHIRLLKRARELGDYLIVGVTSDVFDISRGKINVKQSLSERVEAIRRIGVADKIIVEEYAGQKIDDIQRYDVDIFTVGSDWEGQFDYLKEYCQVVYLPRTEGISSTEVRTTENKLKIGIIGDSRNIIEKFIREGEYVNGLEYVGLCVDSNCDKFVDSNWTTYITSKGCLVTDYEELLRKVDAVYVVSKTNKHYKDIKKALKYRKHVICESPVVLKEKQCNELFALAKQNNCILREALKTSYSLAFNRMLLLIKTGIIGDVVSVDATCTSLSDKIVHRDGKIINNGSMDAWAPAALLAIFKILGTDYNIKYGQTFLLENHFDFFTKIDFIYETSVASLRVGKGVKSEGSLVVSGTKGYIYVPSPWWKMNYFEVRYENAGDTQRYFYQLKGEGIRNMIVDFVKDIRDLRMDCNKIPTKITLSISKCMEEFHNGVDMLKIPFLG